MKEDSYMLSGDEQIRSCTVFRTLKGKNIQDEMFERKFSRNVDKSEDFQDSSKKLEDYYTENIQVAPSNESTYRQSFAHTGKAGKEKDETCPLLLTCSTETEVEVCEQANSGSLEFTKNTDQTKNTEQNKTVISLEHSYCHDCDINEDPQRPVSLANQNMIGTDKSEKKMVSILPHSINMIKAEKQRFDKTNTEDSYEILEYQKSEKHVVLRMNKRKHLSYPKEFTIKIPDQSDIANAKVRRMEGNTPNLQKEEAYQEKEQFDSTDVSERSKADANKDAGTRKKIVLPLCLVCHDAFTSVESLQEHVEVRKHQQICQGQTDFQCHICHKFLRSEWDLKFHRRLKHTEKKNKKLKEHHAGQMEVHNIGILCNQCDKQFRSEDSLHAHIQKSKHEQVSIKVTEFKCISCNTYFVDNWNLEFHMIATGHLPGSLPSSEGIQFIMQKWLTCPEYDSKYSSLKELNKHIKVNQHKENYSISYLDLKCSQCDIFFANSAELYDHVIGFGHQIQVCREGSGSSHRTYSEGKKVFSTLCYYCNRIFESVDDCNAHLMWHDHEETCLNETHYKCYTCRQYFLRHADIMCHMKRTQHSGSWVSQERKMFELKSKSKNKTFCCTSCHTLFDTMAGIRDHIESAHFCGDETVKCPCCTQTFTNINLQQIHLAEVHEGEYPFKCQECGLVFFNKGNFTKHTMKHTYESRASSSLNQAIMLKERCSPDGSDELKRLGLFINNIQKRMEIMKIQRSLHPCGPADENGIIRDQLEEEQTCIQCSETFSSYYELRVHVMGSGHEQVVDEDSPYMCFTCSRRFIKFADLELHMDLSHHSGNESTTRDRLGNMIGQFPKLLHLKGTGKSNRRYKCSRCLRIFTRKGLIDQHIRENACYLKWSKNCPCCLVKYDSRNIYAAHLHQVHICEYPFVCKEQDCKKLFYSFQAFMWHAGSHGIHEETGRNENMTNHRNLRFTSTEENGTQGDGIATYKSEVDNTSYPASSMDIEESELADPCLGRSQEKLENKLEAKVNYCHDETKEKCTSDSDDDREGFYNTTEPKRINSMFVLSCSSRIKRPYKDLAGSVASTREFIAKYTVGKINAAIFLIPTVVLFALHIFFFVLGTTRASECSGKPLIPVYLVLLGGGGVLKCLSFILQLSIVWQVGMDGPNAVEFMSETSVLDNGLNWMYIFFIIFGWCISCTSALIS
ncbi:hypothetical protein FSP39_018099 [Pinctada imbricata]|uniref:C2H2-type domain-containing protein n=1 Tax=Pinctada imbricata TaxID=66713 RepID=A0AA88YF08_PINIB|nr:hypothetical protein FSP39_018099 [Pinctada imbricata]